MGTEQLIASFDGDWKGSATAKQRMPMPASSASTA